MKEVSIIGIDLAKQVFQLHGATADGEVVFRKKLSRKQFAVFMEAHPCCCDGGLRHGSPLGSHADGFRP